MTPNKLVETEKMGPATYATKKDIWLEIAPTKRIRKENHKDHRSFATALMSSKKIDARKTRKKGQTRVHLHLTLLLVTMKPMNGIKRSPP